MVEALWSVLFMSGLQSVGAGVVVLETGRIFGGDSNYYYVGSYMLSGSTINAKIEVVHFFGPQSTVLGPVDRLDLVLEGRVENNQMRLVGAMPGSSQVQIAMQLNRLHKLP